MYPLRLALFALVIAPFLSAQGSVTQSSDGMALLQRMSDHYAGASSWYIEATSERTSATEYNRSWTKTVLISAVSGNKYHYEGHSEGGSAFHISDGKTAWDLHPEERAYTREPAPANGYHPPKEWQLNEQGAFEAVNLRKELAEYSGHYNSASRLPDEEIFQDGIEVPCYVVQVKTEQRKGPKSVGVSLDETLWIDKAAWTVRERVGHENSFFYSGGAHIPLVQDVVTIYGKAELNSAVPEVLFHFEPPADAKLVAKFGDNMLGAGLTDEAAPDIQLVAADGRQVPLSSYRGKPVLLDFWATWCGPCIASMPQLAMLDQEAAPKGLVVLLVDEDEDVKTATDFLANHHYEWPNTQDDGKIGDAFEKMAIPLYVLMDANGKIVFYKSGEDDDGLRKAIAALGPEFASLAPVKKLSALR